MLFRFAKQRASYNIRIEHANLNAKRKTKFDFIICRDIMHYLDTM